MVDEHPRFHLEALRWFATLTRVADVEPAHLVIHTVGRGSSDALDYLRGEGVLVRSVEPFDARSPHCNKIAGALRMAEDGEGGLAVLSDTDVVFLEDPRRKVAQADTVAGKLVDAPVPPLEVIENIFTVARLELPPIVPLPWRPGHHTVTGNFNGGLYLISPSLLPSVTSGWATWARWLLERQVLLGESAIYVDQVAMALCLAEQRIEPEALDPRWNTPIHDRSNRPPGSVSPAVIHYHQEVDRRGQLHRIGVAATDRAIATANEAIRTVFDVARPDDTYRRWLTLSGKRSAALESSMTATAVRTLIDALRPTTILEIGVASPALAPVADPLRTSLTDGSAEQLGGAHADLTLCLNRFTQTTEPDDYRDSLRRLWGASTMAMIVTGYEEPPDLDDRDGHFHEPLSVTLRDLAPDAELYRVAVEPPLATFAALRPPAQPHPRDFGPTTLSDLSERHPDLLGLAVLRLHARTTTTFYPDHAPRLWEYPAVASFIVDELPSGSTLVDVGAGVTPLAPYLSSLGYLVDTVDPSSVQRRWPPAAEWNEWDYLDYGAAGLAHRSWNTTLQKIPAGLRFDGVYSVSVIEHIAAHDRRRLLAEMAARLQTGGLVVVTIDLVRGSSDLWNRNLGVEVEDPNIHGTLDDVVLEARQVGLELIRREAVREWGDVEVDIGLLAFRRLPMSMRDRGRQLTRPLRSILPHRTE